jgi:hypothetical protein
MRPHEDKWCGREKGERKVAAVVRHPVIAIKAIREAHTVEVLVG